MSLNKNQWELITQTVMGTRSAERIEQQGLYRLFQSIVNGDDYMIRRLIEHGVMLDGALLKEGETCAPGAIEFFPVDFPYNHITPVTWAAYNDNVDALSVLYDNGADLLFPSIAGRDAMTVASWNNSVKAWDWIKKTTVESGLNISWNQRSNDGKRITRLMDAVIHRCVFAVKDIANQVDVSAVDAIGRTALHHNFLQDPYTEDDTVIARILIDYGAPVRVEDHDGVSVAALANRSEHEMLLDNALLRQVTEEAHLRAEAQRNRLKASQPEGPKDPSDPGFPQIQKPVKFKRPLM